MEMVGTRETRTTVLNSSTWPFPKNKAWKMEQENKGRWKQLTVPTPGAPAPSTTAPGNTPRTPRVERPANTRPRPWPRAPA